MFRPSGANFTFPHPFISIINRRLREMLPSFFIFYFTKMQVCRSVGPCRVTESLSDSRERRDTSTFSYLNSLFLLGISFTTIPRSFCSRRPLASPSPFPSTQKFKRKVQEEELTELSHFFVCLRL